MPQDRLAGRLRHILEAAAAIEQYTAGKTLETYAAESMLRDAVERNLERLSEAARHIPDLLRSEHGDIDWPGVAALGNVLRHEYDQVLDEEVWQIITKDLAPLREAVEAMLRQLENEA